MKVLQKERIHSRKNPWTIEDIKDGFNKHNLQHGHFPSANEIDECGYLPSARTIERSFGGLVSLRMQLGLKEEVQDLRKGEHSTNRAKNIQKRGYELENEVYKLLCERFSKPLVHREYFYTDDHRARADFFVFDDSNGFCVDVFYAATRRNVSGCLNMKQKKYFGTGGSILPYPVIFLQMNEKFDQNVLDEIHANKSHKLTDGYYLMDYDMFKKFCEHKAPLNILANWNKRKHELE